MSRAAIIFLTGSIIVIYFMGPYHTFRPKKTESLAAVARTKDLDDYLMTKELKVENLKRDLAKEIIWQDRTYRKPTLISLVYLHGFSASRKDISPVVENLSHQLNANAFFTRFKAHGLENGDEFAKVTPQDWLDDAREALAIGRRIGQKVVLVGSSTGALLAAILAAEEFEKRDIAAMILISPNFGIRDWRTPFAVGPFGRFLVRATVGKIRSFPVENDMHGHIWTSSYKSEGLVALNELLNFGKDVSLYKVNIPTLMLYTHQDKVVDLAAMIQKTGELPNPQNLNIDMTTAKRHELTGNALAPENVTPTIEKIMKFLKNTVPGA